MNPAEIQPGRAYWIADAVGVKPYLVLVDQILPAGHTLPDDPAEVHYTAVLGGDTHIRTMDVFAVRAIRGALDEVPEFGPFHEGRHPHMVEAGGRCMQVADGPGIVMLVPDIAGAHVYTPEAAEAFAGLVLEKAHNARRLETELNREPEKPVDPPPSY